MVSLFDKGSFAPCPSPFNMAAHVLRAGEATPLKTALKQIGTTEEIAWSYADLRAAILGTATGLLRQGLQPGDIILMRLGNTVDTPIAYLATLAAGLVPVPTSSALTEPETAHLIRTVKPALMLRAPGIACAPFGKTVWLNALQEFRTLPPAPFHLGDPNRLGYIIFTSGTAGQPRAVAHAHRAIWARQMMFENWYGLQPDDRVLHAGAFNWTYTMGTGLMDPWTRGATALIPAPGVDPGHLPALLRTQRATIFAAAPGIYRQMMARTPAFDLPELRHGLSAGEKLPADTRSRWQQTTGRPIFEAFGMSECSTFISQAPGQKTPPGSIGRPQSGRRIALLRDGHPVAFDEEGTIAIHRDDPGLMLGYYQKDHLDVPVTSGDWFLTGDQAAMAADGSITYLGRRDDMMNAGGYRVSPIEVETVLTTCPGVSAVAVTCVEIKPNVEVIAAFYTGPAPLAENVIDAFVSQQLAGYKRPRLYKHMTKLPQGANGKILRRTLRTQFER
ncbi:MAG: class I adenylate-forming enzyme family protein [Roseobacter sp.]